MDVRQSDQYYYFLYDPQLYGYSLDYWKEVGGAAQLVSNNIRLTTDAIASKEQYKFGDFIFNLTVPTAPATGDSKIWGLLSPVLGTSQNVAYFEISGSTFQGVVANDDGTQTAHSITWDSSWTNTAVDFRIHWRRDRVTFYANGVKIAEEDDVSLVPKPTSLSVYLKNDNFDSLDMSYLLLRNVFQVMAPKWAVSDAGGTSALQFDIAKFDTITVSESVTMSNPLAGIDLSDSVTVAENVNIALGHDVNVNDAISVAEDVTMLLELAIDTSDTVTVAESITVGLS